MKSYLIRVFISESQWTDTVIRADSDYNAQSLGRGQSPIGRATLLREVF